MCSCQSLEQRGYSDVRTRNNKRLQASRNSLADLLEKRFLEGKKKRLTPLQENFLPAFLSQVVLEKMDKLQQYRG